jgi:serine/threonine-protein kinase
MDHETFLKECEDFWTTAIAAVVGTNAPDTSIWHGLNSIHDALKPFMAGGRNHAHLPTDGGMDVEGIDYSTERGCLELRIDDNMSWIIRPSSLTQEVFPNSLINSFLLLELADLAPTEVYEKCEADCERLLETRPGKYVTREVWNRGYLGHDENGREIPLPTGSRFVERWFRGKILFVAKGSSWNGIPATYDGRHNSMTAAEIRQTIERSLKSR